MPAQIVEVDGALFNSLVKNQHSIRAALWEAGFDTARLWRDAMPSSILIEADIARYELGHRPILQDSIVALAIVRTGAAPSIWPRRLPAAAVERLINALEPIMCSIEGLSAHERLELAIAFDSARQSPATAAEVPELLPPRTKLERKLRVHGLRLTRAFGADLDKLDALVSRYGDSVRRADLEECVAALSSCSELGIRLRLSPGGRNGDSAASLLTISRRSSLESLMESVAGLSDATLHSLASHAPHSKLHDPALTLEGLAHIQSIVTNSAHRQTRHPWRNYDEAEPVESRHAPLGSPVPSVAVLNAVRRWIRHSDCRRWSGVHPLVAAAILHTEFVRLRPFEIGTRRVGRICLQSYLYAAGWPVLPWSFAFDLRHDEYRAALGDALSKRSYQRVVMFLLEACRTAVSKGEAMVPDLQQERQHLAATLSTDPDICPEDAQLYAEALLSSLFLEGFSSARGLQNRRAALQRLHAAGVIDCIRTPIGAVYSVRRCRELLKGTSGRE